MGVALLSSSCSGAGSVSLQLAWEGEPPAPPQCVQATVSRAGSDSVPSGFLYGTWDGEAVSPSLHFDDLQYETDYVVLVKAFPVPDDGDCGQQDELSVYAGQWQFSLVRGRNTEIHMTLYRAPGPQQDSYALTPEGLGDAGLPPEATVPVVTVESVVSGRVGHRCVALQLAAESTDPPDAVEISSVPFDLIGPGLAPSRCRLPGAEASEREELVDCGIELLEAANTAGVWRWRVPGWSLCPEEGQCDRSVDGERAECLSGRPSGVVYVRLVSFVRSNVTAAPYAQISIPYAAPHVELDPAPPGVGLTVAPRLAGPDSNVCLTVAADEELSECGNLSAFHRPSGASAEWEPSVVLPLSLSNDARNCQVCRLGSQFPEEGDYLFEARVQDLVGHASCLGRTSCDQACADELCAPPSERSADLTIDSGPPALLELQAGCELGSVPAVPPKGSPTNRLRPSETFCYRLTFNEAVYSPSVTVGGQPIPCEPVSPTQLSCKLEATPDVGDGKRDVIGRALDVVGNLWEEQRLGELWFDVEAPRATALLSRVPDFSRSTGGTVWFTAQHPFDGRPVHAALTVFTNKPTVPPRVELVAGHATPGQPCPMTGVPTTDRLQPDPTQTDTQFTFDKAIDAWVRERLPLPPSDAPQGAALDPDEEVYRLCARFSERDDDPGTVVELEPTLGLAWGTPENGIDLEKTIFRRAPWGSSDGSYQAAFSVQAFAKGTPDEAAPFPMTDVVVSSDARVPIATSERSGGFAASDPDVGVRVPLASSFPADRAEIYAASVDQAGRVSSFGFITRGEWVATLNRTGGFPNPHRAYAWGVVHSMLRPPYGGDPIDEKLARAGDGSDARSQAQVEWQQLLTGAPEEIPAARSGQGMAYDAARGVTVMFGGEADNGRLLQDTWEWNGLRWRQPDADGELPPARRDGRLAYDAARDRIILFGGRDLALDPQPFPDTWLWDGRSWTRDPRDGPPARYAHALAYDPRHGNVVLAGGTSQRYEERLGDTWLWNGTEWRLASDGPNSFRRSNHAMAFDSSAGQDRKGAVLLFGGASYDSLEGSFRTLADTWEWDGQSWNSLPIEASPAATAQHTMVTGSDGHAIIFGGADQLLEEQVGSLGAVVPDQIMVFDAAGVQGARWSAKRMLSKPCRATTAEDRCVFTDHASVFDSARKQILTLGGRINDDRVTPKRPETWVLEEQRWREPASTAAALDFEESNARLKQPCPRRGHSLSALRDASFVALFGGEVTCDSSAPDEDDTVWSWDGTRWSKVLTPPLTARREHLFVDLDDTTALLFGGIGSGAASVPEAWELALSADFPPVWSWTERGLGECDPRYNSARSRAAAASGGFTFGGVTTGTTSTADLLHWVGTCWEPLSTSGPPARSDAALTQLGSQLLLFSGLGNSGRLPDTWLYDEREGSRGWADVKPREGEIFPVAREGHTLLSTPAGGAALLFGGRPEQANGQGLEDTWIFDGRTWIDVSEAREAQRPGRRVDHAMVVDPNTDRGILFGGTTETLAPSNNETWAAIFPDRPTHTVSFDVSGLGCVDVQTARDAIETRSLVLTHAMVHAVVGGQSTSAGAELWVWQGQGWAPAPAGTNAAAIESPGVLNWETTDAEVLLGLAAGQTIGVQLRPHASTDPTPAQLRSDLVDIDLEYRLDERGTPALMAPLCFVAVSSAGPSLGAQPE